MATIICDISAWQYARTPPLIRDVEVDPAQAVAPPPHGLGFSRRELRERANASEAERLVRSRILTDLKGLTLPVHVMVDASACTMHATRFVLPHRVPKGVGLADCIPLGNDLYVLSPELTLLCQGAGRGEIALAKMMYEACGLFSLFPAGKVGSYVLASMQSQGLLRSMPSSGVYGYCDGTGRPLGSCDAWGNEIGWVPSIDRSGRVTNLWKRPPLTSVERLHDVAARLGGVRGLSVARRALGLVRNGAASPAEVYCCLLLLSGVWAGGESWGDPDLNRQIFFTPQAQALAGTAFCVGDIVWPDRKRILEVQSELWHADREGFYIKTGRTPALGSMGYEVMEITYRQMADLEQFDAILPFLADHLGFGLQKRTVPFLKRRSKLHAQLFGAPYDCC